MSDTRILMANIGYARGINGALASHIRHGLRHFWASHGLQRQTLDSLRGVLQQHHVDIACLLEIDSGSFTSYSLNQMQYLATEPYTYSDIENKYLESSRLRSLPFTKGKSNGFLANRAVNFQKVAFSCGTKRLIYALELEENLTLYFAHFSLNHETRSAQIDEFLTLATENKGEVILMGDFNVLRGLNEVLPKLENSGLTLLNDPAAHTFSFHKQRLVLDLCIASASLLPRLKLEVIRQPYSDHDALMLDIKKLNP